MEHYSWQDCTLCRSGRQGLDTLKRAKQRQIRWPETPKEPAVDIEDPNVYTTIDDAFSTMLQYFSTTSRQCKRYYRSSPAASHTDQDQLHCRRFHSKKRYARGPPANPLQAEKVHILVAPGTYAVTAGGHQQQTHVVHVQQGQSVNLNFTI